MKRMNDMNFLRRHLFIGIFLVGAVWNSLAKDFFPLMAWDDVHDESTVRKMADCGINAIAFVPTNMLDVCDKYGVKAIVFDPLVTPNWDKPYDSEKGNKELVKLINQVNMKPAVWGYFLKDEPGGDQLKALGESAALVRKMAPGKWPYIDVPPGMGDWYDTNYLQTFIDLCKPPMITYDNYPIGESGTFSYGYWANLWDVRSASLRNNVPFNTIVLTSAHLNYRIPSAADLRLQIYGALVYGAKGISYYKFCSRPLSVIGAPDLGNFRMGPLDQFGEKTVTWDYLRNINRQVENISKVLLKLRSDDVYFVGDLPERNHGIRTNDLVQGFESGTRFIIGDFTHEDGSKWVMIVNEQLKESEFCRPKFRDKVGSVRYLSPITGEIEPFPMPWYCLAPGQGVLLKLD